MTRSMQKFSTDALCNDWLWSRQKPSFRHWGGSHLNPLLYKKNVLIFAINSKLSNGRIESNYSLQSIFSNCDFDGESAKCNLCMKAIQSTANFCYSVLLSEFLEFELFKCAKDIAKQSWSSTGQCRSQPGVNQTR